MIADVFKLLEQKRCDEIFNNPSPFFNSIVEDNFLKSYACILCKDSEVAVSYRNVLADFLSKTQSEILAREHKLEAEAACLYLDAHIQRLRMNFLGARELITRGLNVAKEAECHELVFRFMFLQCWMYYYCYHKDLALVYAERMEKYAKTNSLFAPFHTSLCRGLRLFIEHGTDDLNGLDMRAAYFVCEFSGGWLRPEGWNRNSASDYFRPIFGDSSYESVYDKAIGEISFSSSGFDAIREYHDKLTDNQRLICNFRIGRDINIYALDSDSFLLEPLNLANYLEKTQLSEEHRTLLIEKFNNFLHDASFQLNLEVYKPFVSEWFTQFHEQGIEAFCKFLGSRHVYDGIDDELQCGPWTKEHAFRRVMDNMSMLLDLSEQNDSNVTLPVLTELIIRILLYRYYYYKSSSDSDNANTNRIAALIQLDEFNEFDGDSDKGSAYPYHLRSFPEVYHSVVRDIRNLSDSPVIFSVLLDQYVSKSNIINGLCKFWGEYDLDFNKYLKDKLESVFSEFSVGPGHEIKWLDNEKSVGRIHGDKVDIYFSIFSELGEWNAQFEKVIFNTWRCDESKDNISSPVTYLFKEYIKNANREAIGLVVMMPGCYLVSSGPVQDALGVGISLVSYNNICNTAQQYISFSKSEILSMGIDTRIVRDSSGFNWNLFSIYQIIGERSIDLKYTRDYDKLGLFYIIREFARKSEMTSANVVYQAEVKGSTYYVEIKGSVSSGVFKPSSFRFFKKSAFGQDSVSSLPAKFSVDDEKSMVHTLYFSNYSLGLDIGKLRGALKSVLLEKEIVDGLKEVASNQIEKFLQAAIKPFAEKTAKTAIMARNMSHNLGSHVMFYIKQQLSSVNEMLRTKVFDQLFSDENDLLMLLSNPQEWLDNKYKGKEKEGPNIDNVALPFLVGLGRFMSYIQERQDFIASVATNFIPPASSLNFKDFIYDELNPDKRYMRHPDRLGDKPLNILLSYIARSENLGRQSTAASDWSGASQENDIVIKFGDFDGDPVDEINSVGYNPVSHYGNREAVEKASASLAQMRKLDFSIPSGVTGRHAFFSIIENLIRNSAKHGKFDNSIDKGSLKLTLNVYDKKTMGSAPDADNYKRGDTKELSLREVFSRFYLNASDANDLYFVTVTDNLPTTYRNLQSIRKAIMEPYVDVDGRMLENFKGIKEMRICASWLRSSFNEYYPFKKDVQGNYEKDKDGCPPPDTKWTDGYTGNAPTLYVRLSNDHLQYIFAVQKTLNVLILSDCFDPEHDGFMEYDQLNRDVLKPNGWLGMCRSEYENLQKRPDYTFVLWDIASSEESDFNKIRSESNRRTYRISDVDGLDDNFVPGLLKNCNRQYLKDVYEILLRHMSSYHDGDWIFVDDEKAKARFESKHSADPGVGNLVRFVDSDCSAQFVYRTHFETSSTKAFWQFFLAQKHRDVSPDEYTEGVTGANSTDRLVRCDEINMEWFYRHLNIMKRSVAIFDERISDKLFSLSEPITANAGNVRCRDHRPYIMSLKKVWAFNVAKDSEGLFIYGLLPNVLEKIQENSVGRKGNFSLHSHCVEIARIRADKDEYIVDFRAEAEQYKNSFDLISIHQGILDKLYDWLGIKHQNDRMELLTKALYDAFGRGTSVRLPLHDTHYLLPGMSIHSGRSLPSADDMPQHIPFIQFASLENAINDCKYSLVELMEHAYYDRH